MNKKTLMLVGAASLEILSGCGSTRSPQYSGRYELAAEPIYSDPYFAGEKRLPWDLTIIHRMKYIPNTWDDRIRFEFTSQNQNEIRGAVVFDLELLNRADESSFPREYFKGELIHVEKKYYGGAFCNSQYQYHAFAKLTPGEDELVKVYPERGEYIDSENVMPLYEQFDPAEFEPAEEAIDGWYDAIENNGGKISLDFYLSRNIKDDRSGCDQDSYLPYDNRGRESVNALYHSTELHDQEDPRLGFDELQNNTISAIDMFKEAISDVKDLD